jgi:hypothetical protein
MDSKQVVHRPGGTGDPDRSNIMSKTFAAALEAVQAAFPRSATHTQRFWAASARDSEMGVDAYIADLKVRIAAAKKADKELRNLLREKFGKGRFRIRTNGTVDVYGQMPNSNVTGWWYYGETDQAMSA